MYENRDANDEEDPRSDILTTTFTLDTSKIQNGHEPIERLYAKSMRVMLLVNALSPLAERKP